MKAVVWALHDGRRGNANQAEALAGAICRQLGGSFTSLEACGPWFQAAKIARSVLASADSNADTRMVIGCGRKVSSVTAALRRHGFFAVQVMRPGLPLKAFDLVVVPDHDRLQGGNVITMIGAPNAIAHDVVAHDAAAHDIVAPSARAGAVRGFAGFSRPWIGVVLGGSSRHFVLDRSWTSALLDRLERLARDRGGHLLICGSPRSSPGVTQAIKAFGTRQFFWTGESGDNPYRAMLAESDQLVISGDSVNMLSEACATGKPVWIACPPRRKRHTKLQIFHDNLVKGGHARLFEGSLDADQPLVPLCETEAVAAKIIQRLGLRRTGEGSLPDRTG